jgi:5-methylcytosine-specific restriction endonuclease McrA
MARERRKQFSKEERKKVYQKYGGHCAYCGCELLLKDMQVDHFHSVYKSEQSWTDVDNSFENLMPACRACNFYKSTYSLDLFRKMIRGIPKRLEKEFIYKLAIKYNLIEVTDKPVEFYFEKIDSLKRMSQSYQELR